MKMILKIAIIAVMASCTNADSSRNKKVFGIDKIIDTGYNIAENDTLKIKNGLIKESGGLKEVYYRNGKRNGIFKSYFKKNGKLEGIGFYEDDKPIGTWYYFDQNSQIIMIEEKRGINKDKEVKRDDGVKIKPPYVSYVKEYSPKSGLLKGEGLALYFEDIEIDYFKYGKWKEY